MTGEPLILGSSKLIQTDSFDVSCTSPIQVTLADIKRRNN